MHAAHGLYRSVPVLLAASSVSVSAQAVRSVAITSEDQINEQQGSRMGGNSSRLVVETE